MIEFLIHEKNTLENYKEILTTDTIKLWLKWGSQFESTFPLIKTRYIFDGSILPEELIKLLEQDRIQWDDNVLLLETVVPRKDDLYVVHYAVKPPIFFMKAKDFVEKRIRIIEDGVYYMYSSSVTSEVLKETEQYQRCETVFSGSILVKEEENYVYYTFSQVDFKVISANATHNRSDLYHLRW